MGVAAIPGMLAGGPTGVASAAQTAGLPQGMRQSVGGGFISPQPTQLEQMFGQIKPMIPSLQQYDKMSGRNSFSSNPYTSLGMHAMGPQTDPKKIMGDMNQMMGK